MIEEYEIQHTIKSLARNLSADLRGKKVVIVGVLTGGVYFTVDLTREMTIPFELDFIKVKSYVGGKSEEVKLIYDISIDVKGKVVLICDDIADSGKTLMFLIEHFKEKDAAEVHTCTLLNRVIKIKPLWVPNYSGFMVQDDTFFVGYGLDNSGKERNRKNIISLKEMN